MEVRMEIHLPSFRNLKRMKDCISAWFCTPEPCVSNIETIIAANDCKGFTFFFVLVIFMAEVGSCYLKS